MAQIYREWRVVAASIFAVAAITGSYFLARGAAAPRIAQASTESALLAQIATKDSTGDGLPDWQKSLYGIPLDAQTTDYFHLGMTDGQAVAKGLIVPVAATPAAATPAKAGAPQTAASFGLTAPSEGSLTDVFAKNFFALYISASQSAGGSLTDDQINTIASQALTSLSSSIVPAPDFKTAADIKISGSGPDALKAYAASAENVFTTYQPKVSKTDLAYLQDSLSNPDSAPTDLAGIHAMATSYRNIATGLAALSVPQEAAGTHLALINALARMAGIDTDFSNVSSDPLSSILALQQYPQAQYDIANALGAVSNLFATNNVALPTGTPGTYFANASANLAAAEKANASTQTTP